MERFILVDWPERQKFEEHERYDECWECYHTGDGDFMGENCLAVPESLYNQVIK